MLEHHRGSIFPVLPLRDIVVFPHMIVPLFVGREKSVRALEDVMKDDKQILLVTQKNAAQDDPTPADIYHGRHDRHGAAAAEAARRHREGAGRGRPARAHHEVRRQRSFFEADAELIGEKAGRGQGSRGAGAHRRVAVRAVHQAEQEDPAGGAGLDQPDRGSEQARGHGCLAPVAEDPREAGAAGDRHRRRAAGEGLCFMEGEIGVLQVEKRIRSRVKRQMEKTQREYYLNEQLKAIQKELGEGEDGRDELAELEERIKKTQLLQGSPREGAGGAEEAALHEPDVGRSDGRAQLPRLDAVAFPGRSRPRSSATSGTPRRC